MKVGIIAPLYNEIEKQFVVDLIKKIKAIGFESEIAGINMLDYDIVAVVFDGRNLPDIGYDKLKQFVVIRDKQIKKKNISNEINLIKDDSKTDQIQESCSDCMLKKIIIGYLTADLEDKNIGIDKNYLIKEKKFLDHLATTELNFISCLKDYIYYHQHGKNHA